jgi:hypothetical protein
MDTPANKQRRARTSDQSHLAKESEAVTPERPPTGPMLSLQRSAGNQAILQLLGRGGSTDESAALPPPIEEALQSPGQPLDPDVRRANEQQLGRDFSQVRTHTDSQAAASASAMNARAYTVDNDIVFGQDKYAPDTLSGRFLLSHELAHVAQQRPRTPDEGAPAVPLADRAAESEANTSGLHGAFGMGPMHVGHTVAPGTIHASSLSDTIDVLWNDKNKALIFDHLRRHAPVSDPDADVVLTRIFAPGSDDLWLAQTIMQYGPEPLWPTDAFTERRRRQRDNKWPDEPGNIKGLLAVSKGGKPVEAFFFPGKSDERALVIAGVHGSEQGGIEVAEMLRETLRTAPTRPYYSVILVPTLFPDNAAKREREGATPTNRNFPKPGTSLSQATATAGAGKPLDATGRAILPENIALLNLIERFRPSRIVSVHGSFDRGAAGLFSDPHTVTKAAKDKARAAHPGDPKAADAAVAALEAAAAAKTKADHDLVIAGAKEMAKRGAGEAVKGNQLSGTPTSGWSGEVPGGTSLGGWAPSDISEGRTTDRPSMTLITVEVAENKRSTDFKKEADQAKRKTELAAYRDVIQEMFLGPP